MLENLEPIGQCADAAAKMSEILARGIGTLYAPTHKKKMADATAYEIRETGKALADVGIPGKLEDGVLSFDNTGKKKNDKNPEEALSKPDQENDHAVSPLDERINNRITHQERIKQKNLEAIIGRAMRKLKGRKADEKDTVEQEWTLRFINTAAYICTEPLQEIWASVLAGKILNSRSVSLRTLELLKNLSSDEADLFIKIIPFVFLRENDCFLWASGGILELFNICFKDILLLDECGLVQAGDTSLKFSRKERSCYDTSFHNTRILVRLHMHPDSPNISVRQYPLTHAGRELYRILRTEPNADFIKAVASYVAAHRKSRGIEIRMHQHWGEDDSFAHDSSVLQQYSGSKVPSVNDPININKADEIELSALPSVTITIARNIINYRNTLDHPIETLDELLNVKGIGEKRLETLRPYATV